MNKTLSVIIPAYNEEQSLQTYLPEVIRFCSERQWNLIVVNDGSSDKTRSVLEKYSGEKYFHAIHHKLNRGYGGALKSGVEAAETDIVVTIDADGQHELPDIENLYKEYVNQDADMVVGRRSRIAGASAYREAGKWLIRKIAKMLMPINIYDINSGMKMYDARLGKKYIRLCPDSMAYSDIIALTFIAQRHRVLEIPIHIKPRKTGSSTINTRTAFETLKEILGIVILFNPLRVFLPLAVTFIIAGFLWGLPIVLDGRGISGGAMLGIVTGLIFFFLGLIAEQLSLIRKSIFNK